MMGDHPHEVSVGREALAHVHPPVMMNHLTKARTEYCATDPCTDYQTDWRLSEVLSRGTEGPVDTKEGSTIGTRHSTRDTTVPTGHVRVGPVKGDVHGLPSASLSCDGSHGSEVGRQAMSECSGLESVEFDVDSDGGITGGTADSEWMPLQR